MLREANYEMLPKGSNGLAANKDYQLSGKAGLGGLAFSKALEIQIDNIPFPSCRQAHYPEHDLHTLQEPKESGKFVLSHNEETGELNSK